MALLHTFVFDIVFKSRSRNRSSADEVEFELRVARSEDLVLACFIFSTLFMSSLDSFYRDTCLRLWCDPTP